MTIDLLRPVNSAASESAPKGAKAAADGAQPSFGQLLAARQKNDAESGSASNQPMADNARNGSQAPTRANADKRTGAEQPVADRGAIANPNAGDHSDTAHEGRALSTPHSDAWLGADAEAGDDTDARQDSALPAGLVWREITVLHGAQAQSGRPAQAAPMTGAADSTTSADGMAALMSPGAQPLTPAGHRAPQRSGLNVPAERTLDLRSARDGSRQLPTQERVARVLDAAPAPDAAAQNATHTADRVAAAFGERLAERLNTAGSASDRRGDEAAPLTAGLSAPAHAGQAMAAAPAAAAPANAAAALTAPLGSQAWHQALSQQALRLSHSGDGSAEITLYPRELGQLHVSLKLGEQAHLHFASPHADVRAAVEAALPQLRHALADNGINLAQTSVSDQGPGQGQQQGSNDSARGPQAAALRGPGAAADGHDALAAPMAVATLTGRTLDGGIDIFA